MGKNLRHKVTCSPIQNHPGFMWGLFDILKHNHWRYIKKRLPHKRPLCTRNSAGTKNEVNNTIPSPDGITLSKSKSKSKVEDKTDVDSEQSTKKPTSAVKSKESNSGEKTRTQNNSEKSFKKLNAEERARKTHSEIKRSVKALIKALVLEDKKSKKKGRHHRSSTYPVHSNPKEKESSSDVEGSSDKSSSNGVFRKSVGISPAIGSLNPLYLMSEESSNSDSEDFRLDNNTVDDNTDGSKSDFDEKEFKKKEKSDEAWFDPKFRHTKDQFSENEYDSSPRSSKACLDALNLIHMNRNFLLKVLQDPGSPLARHFQSQQAFSSKTMTKAGSFPIRGSNREDHNNGFDSVVDIDKKPMSPSIAAEHRADGIQNMNETMAKLAADEDSSGYASKRGKNQVVIKRFKDLRQKIKHVINENKNEKHRITMDAVLDKVPRKYGFSKDLRQDIFAHLKGSSVTKNNNNNKSDGVKLKQITRTSSLCGSLDRYLQLYESNVQREGKSNNNNNNSHSEKSKLEFEESALPSKRVPKYLGRILSLPEMKSYSLKIDDLPCQSIEEEEQVGLENISEVSEDHSQSSEHETVENSMEATEDPSFDEENKTPVIDTEQDRELSLFDAEPEKESSEECTDVVSTVDFDEIVCKDQDPDTEIVSRSKQLDEVLHIEAQDKLKFNYVRDILEISGFNAPESLSMWQSDHQPLDPLVYEEVTATGGCMIQDPDCSSRNEEEGGNCNHLLLFDLINEVLIEIYERSYHYCPKPLSSLCKIHPMPVGYSVLKEVWVRISCYLRYKPYDEQQSFDKIMSRDLSRDDGWMDLQFESECVGIEVEDLIFEELLEELLV